MVHIIFVRKTTESPTAPLLSVVLARYLKAYARSAKGRQPNERYGMKSNLLLQLCSGSVFLSIRNQRGRSLSSF